MRLCIFIYSIFLNTVNNARNFYSIERLARANIDASVGSIGDSYDNALAETINGLYKTEVIRHRGSWRNFDDVEFATLEWVNWFNNRRLLEPIRDIPPTEFEMAYYRQLRELTDAVWLKTNSLQKYRDDSVWIHQDPLPWAD